VLPEPRMGLWRRNPLIPVGVLLIVVGLGNWYTGRDKAVEHERLLHGDVPAGSLQKFEEFDKLTARTNASLLRPFQQGADPSALLRAKLDFYRVVQTGGWLLVLLGLFSAIAGVIHSWYRLRVTGREAPPSHAA
jgi:hypothetical protein